MVKLLTENNKTVKGSPDGRRIFIQHFAPAKLSGHEVCPKRTKACTEFCLNTAGMGVFKNVQDARIKRTKLYFEQNEVYWSILTIELTKLVNKHGKIAVRLNGTSDIDFFASSEGRQLASQFDDVVFYDYTKDISRCKKWSTGHYPANYYLVFSDREIGNEILVAMNHGVNIAHINFNDDDFEHSFDEHDARYFEYFENKRGIVGNLVPKGKAWKFKNPIKSST